MAQAKFLHERFQVPKDFRWMTAEEWDSSEDLWLMLHNAEQQTNDWRKLSLFGVACCRSHGKYLHEQAQEILAEFEDMIDQLRLPTESEVLDAGDPLCHRANVAVGLVDEDNSDDCKWRLATAKAVCYAVIGSAFGATSYFEELDSSKKFHHVQILRDLFGNPFRPSFIHGRCRTERAVSLAREMYEKRDFRNMALLADALEKTDCAADVLTHCRSSNPHYRGCWVVDSLLGRIVNVAIPPKRGFFSFLGFKY